LPRTAIAPFRLTDTFVGHPALITDPIEYISIALQFKGMVLLDMISEFIHETTIQMNEFPAFSAFQMQMFCAVAVLSGKLVHRLFAGAVRIFEYNMIRPQFIQIAVNRGPING
jgi:hypothetical protein